MMMCSITTEVDFEHKIMEIISINDNNVATTSYIERRNELIKELERGEEIDLDTLRRPVTF